MDFEFLVNKVLYRISLEKAETGFIVREGDKSYEADIQEISPNIVSVLVGGRSYQVCFAREEKKLYVDVNGYQFIVEESVNEETGFKGAEGKSQEDMLLITAPMPGKLVKILVSEKDKVRKNQTLAIVEAMKMENEIKSSVDGRVKKILASVGELVDSEKPFIELESTGNGKPE